MTHDFTGRFIAVTGSSGIGLGAALHMARSGARVFLAGIDIARNDEAAAMAAAEGLHLSLHQVDIADEDSVRSRKDRIAAETGALHELVNAAGQQSYGTAETAGPAERDRAIAVNLRSCYLTSHILYPMLKAARGAAVVHVSSVQGHNNQDNVLAHAASKGGVHALTRAMAVDSAKDGIRVNSISPGSIRTQLLEFSASRLATGGKSIDDMTGEFAASHPVGRVGTTEETGSLIACLCSDAAAFIAGADLRVDGGLTAQLGV